MGKFIKYFFGAIALYIGVEYSTGSGTLINDGANGAATFTKALQGR
jgi:hypothetical protein